MRRQRINHEPATPTNPTAAARILAARMLARLVPEESRETPDRVARMYAEVFAGLHRDPRVWPWPPLCLSHLE